MKMLSPGHKYELASFEGGPPQVIQFIEKRLAEDPHWSPGDGGSPMPPTFKTINDGMTNEEVLAVLIDRLQTLNAKLPNKHTEMATGLCRAALQLLNMRTAERKARGVEGTPKA